MQSNHTVHYKAVEEAFLTTISDGSGGRSKLDLLPLSMEAKAALGFQEHLQWAASLVLLPCLNCDETYTTGVTFPSLQS